MGKHKNRKNGGDQSGITSSESMAKISSSSSSTEASSQVQLSKAQLGQFRTLFNMIDQDHDGQITSKDLKTTIVGQGIESVDDDAIMTMLKDGEPVAMPAFLKLMAEKYGKFSEEEDLKDALAVFKNAKYEELRSSLLQVGVADPGFRIEEKDLDRVLGDFTKENKVTGEKTFMAERFVEATN